MLTNFFLLEVPFWDIFLLLFSFGMGKIKITLSSKLAPYFYFETMCDHLDLGSHEEFVIIFLLLLIQDEVDSYFKLLLCYDYPE